MGKVLIVEDNELNLKLFCDLLVIKNHEILVSRDGIGVVKMALDLSPDLILMDIQLSDISGADLISDLKRNPRTKKIPIIAITAFAMRNDEVKILETGCDLYMSKPVSIDNFFLSIEKFMKN